MHWLYSAGHPRQDKQIKDTTTNPAIVLLHALCLPAVCIIWCPPCSLVHLHSGALGPANAREQLRLFDQHIGLSP